MQDDFSSLISRYDELSASENGRLEVLAGSDAERAELLAFVKRLFGGPDKRHALASAADAEATVQQGAFEDLLQEGESASRYPRPEDIVEYVLAMHFHAGRFSPDQVQQARVRALVEGSPDVRTEVDALLDRLGELNSALPAIDHFERLTGIRLADVDRSPDSPMDVPLRLPQSIVREPVPERISRIPVRRASRSIVRNRVVSAMPAMTILLATIALGIRLTAVPDVSSFVRVEVYHPDIVERVRSTNPVGEAYLERLRTDVMGAIDVPGGRFNKFDKGFLLSLKDDIEHSLDSTTANPTVERDELLFLIASVDWALGDFRLATLGFGTVAAGDGPRSPAARRALQEVEAEASRRSQ